MNIFQKIHLSTGYASGIYLVSAVYSLDASFLCCFYPAMAPVCIILKLMCVPIISVSSSLFRGSTPFISISILVSAEKNIMPFRQSWNSYCLRCCSQYQSESVMSSGKAHTMLVDSVHLEFGKQTVLQSAFITAECGKVTGVLGRNGSGKSCFFKCIMVASSPRICFSV